MFNTKVMTLVILVAGLELFTSPVLAQETKLSTRKAMYYRYLEWPLLKGGSIQAHWMADGNSFWYAEGAPANTVIWKIDPRANTKLLLFDTARLRKALTPLLGYNPPYQGLPFDKFTFVDGEKAVKFTVENQEFILQLDTYKITPVPWLSEAEKNRLVPHSWRIDVSGGAERNIMELLSPDRRWFAGVKDYNLWLRSTYDGRSMQITTDGIQDHEWKFEGARWSPDSFKMAVKKVDNRRVHSIPIVHCLGPTEEVTWVKQAKPSGPFPQTELFIIDILSKQQVRIDTGEDPDQHFHLLEWRPDGAELLFLRLDRESKRMDLMAANPTTGAARVMLTETQKTFVMGWEFFDVNKMDWLRPFTVLKDDKRFIWVSERDGWKHLYLYDMDGTLIRRLTQGAFTVVRVVAVDDKAGWVYFTAHNDKHRPYDTHLCRVSLKGKEFMQLTDVSGQHAIQFTPSKQFFMDTHSTTARLPAVELRRADGTLVQTLSKASIDALKARLKWNPPEEFVVKAADEETDLYGVLYKPYDFDPNKKYPVIERIYAGPQTTAVPQTFVSNWGGIVDAQALAQLGFIVLVVDGRGTPERGKEFQDVVYGNIGRYEIPDHVAALKQVAEKRPYMDLSRVGVYGVSAGGYSTIRAMLLAPDVYHVGIATNADGERSDHSYDEVVYMGLPENNKEGYEYGSNIRLVGNLKGKLLLIQSTADAHGTFAWAMKLVEALIRAGKPYDLIVLPEQPHWAFDGAAISFRYVQETTCRYFQEHLNP